MVEVKYAQNAYQKFNDEIECEPRILLFPV